MELMAALKVNLVVPGPEQPLVDGIEAMFRKGATSATLVSRSNLRLK